MKFSLSILTALTILVTSTEAFSRSDYSATCECSIGGRTSGSGESRGEAMDEAVEKCTNRTQSVKTNEGLVDCRDDALKYFIDVVTLHTSFNCRHNSSETIFGYVGDCDFND